MKAMTTTLVLSRQSIDEISEKIYDAGTACKCKRRELLRLRLVLEDILLHWLQQDPPNKKIQLTITRKYFDLKIKIIQKGPYLSSSIRQDEEEESLLKGIISIGSPQKLNTTLTRLLRHILKTCSLNSILATFLLLIVFPIYDSASSNAIDFDKLRMQFSIMPTNLLQPFLEGTMLQILLLATIIGIAIIHHHNEMQPLIQIIHMTNSSCINILKAICRLLPIMIFLSLCNILLTRDLSSILQMSSMLFGCISMAVLLFITTSLNLAGCMKVNPLQFIKKIKLPLLTGLTTASSMAAFPLLLRICEPALGIAEDFNRFAIPLEQVLNKTGGNLARIALVIITCYYTGITMDWITLLLLIVISNILSIVVIPVAGGALASVAILFQIMNMPEETISIAIVAFSLADHFVAVDNVMGSITATAINAHTMNKLDTDILNK